MGPSSPWDGDQSKLKYYGSEYSETGSETDSHGQQRNKAKHEYMALFNKKEIVVKKWGWKRETGSCYIKEAHKSLSQLMFFFQPGKFLCGKECPTK